MQAHGHEDIEKIVGSYLYYLLKQKHGNISNGIKSVCKTEQDFINLLYLGNWVTDMSQLLVPDFFYELRKNLNTKIDTYNTTLDDIAPFVGSKLETHYKELFDNQFYKHWQVRCLIWEDHFQAYLLRN